MPLLSLLVDNFVRLNNLTGPVVRLNNLTGPVRSVLQEICRAYLRISVKRLQEVTITALLMDEHTWSVDLVDAPRISLIVPSIDSRMTLFTQG